MDKTHKIVVIAVLTIVPMCFQPLVDAFGTVKNPVATGEEPKAAKANPAVVGGVALLFVAGVLVGGKAWLDRSVPTEGAWLPHERGPDPSTMRRE